MVWLSDEQAALVVFSISGAEATGTSSPQPEHL
jgi:hypothetical protein